MFAVRTQLVSFSFLAKPHHITCQNEIKKKRARNRDRFISEIFLEKIESFSFQFCVEIFQYFFFFYLIFFRFFHLNFQLCTVHRFRVEIFSTMKMIHGSFEPSLERYPWMCVCTLYSVYIFRTIHSRDVYNTFGEESTKKARIKTKNKINASKNALLCSAVEWWDDFVGLIMPPTPSSLHAQASSTCSVLFLFRIIYETRREPRRNNLSFSFHAIDKSLPRRAAIYFRNVFYDWKFPTRIFVSFCQLKYEMKCIFSNSMYNCTYLLSTKPTYDTTSDSANCRTNEWKMRTEKREKKKTFAK